MILGHCSRTSLIRGASLLLAIAGSLFGCASPSETTDTGRYTRSYEDAGRFADDAAILTNDLRSRLELAEPGEFVSVIIRLSSQPNLRDAEAYISASGKPDQRAAAIAYLQSFADDSQGNLLLAARELEADGLVRNIHALWIANAISLDLTREAITYLSEYQDIEYIAWGNKQPVLMSDPTWSVEHINSPQVWQRAAGAIRGSGVVVAVVDTGVDFRHPDLADRIWINPAEDIDGDGRFSKQDVNGIDEDGNGWTDDVAGWDFEAEDNDPSANLFQPGRAIGHGTHIAGIIAGNGSEGLATGVAPDAEIMILKVNSQVSTWQAMEYALVNGAHVINLSIGWPGSVLPDAAIWRDAVDNATDAGVLVVTAAGNGGNAPMVHATAPNDITVPGRVPRALTVAAVAAPSGSEWLDPIATFSAAGPVSWQSVSSYRDYPYPPGLMKPDLTAPGINISSTIPGGGYDVMSGTSMAAAHVSGAAALLLDADPTLQPHDIAYVLRETAWRFTDPNDVRGWGRLDAFSAINHRTNRVPYDLAFEERDASWLTNSIWIDNNNDGIHDSPNPGGTNRIFARMRNDGGQNVGNAELRFYYAPVGTLDARWLSAAASSDVFQYIGSYHVPVTGPAGSSQDTATGAVEWVAPHSDGRIGHWTVAVEAIAAKPVNPAEGRTENNRVVRNSFDIVMAPGQTSAFGFNIYGDPDQVESSLNLELIRSSHGGEFEVELSFDDDGTSLAYEGLYGLAAAVSDGRQSMALLQNRAQLVGIQLPNGKPRPARLVIRAPEVGNEALSSHEFAPTSLTINARNDSGIFGGFTVNVRIDEDAAKLNRIIYAQK